MKNGSKRVKKNKISARSLWMITFFAGIFFLASFMHIAVFPRKWLWRLLIGLGMFLLCSGGVSLALGKKGRIIKAVNVVAAACFLIAGIFLPYYQDRVADLFVSVIGDKVKINLYVMNNDYREAHWDVFGAMQPETLVDCAGGVFLTAGALDGDNSEYALEKVKDAIGNVAISDCTSAFAAAQALYANKGMVLVMSEGYESLVKDTPEFEFFDEQTTVIGSYYRTVSTVSQIRETMALTKKPFSIFIGGNDQEGELSVIGRTDVDMLITVNPRSHQISIVSLPRDSYIANPALSSQKDKLTHLGLSGIENTLEGFGDYMNVDIENYVLVNFTTFKQIIDALGGVDVDNPYAFSYFWDSQYVYPQGRIHLDGDAALFYVRERYNLVNGDFDRNMHQQLVMRAIIEKATSREVITHFNELLKALNGTFLTNVSSDAMFALGRMQLEDDIQWNVVNKHISGTTGMEVCASAVGMPLSVVYPDEEEAEHARELIQAVIRGEIISE